jgi:hypothetical protein
MLHHLDSPSKDQFLAEIRRVLRPDGQLILADAVVDGHGHGHRGRPSRMQEQLHDNVGDAVSRRITAAGFTVEPTRTITVGKRTKIGIELARVS